MGSQAPKADLGFMDLAFYSFIVGDFKMSKIFEGTLLPISFVIVIMGGVFWLSSMYAETKANSAAIDKMELKLEYIQSIDKRLAIIESELKRLGR